MDNKFQYFDIDTSINDDRDIRGIILKNNIKIVLISDTNIINSVCTVGVGAGYLQDEFQGTAHFLEHLLFMGSEKYPEKNEYPAYVQTCGGQYNAYTTDNSTVYYLALETHFFKKGVEMLSWFFKKPLLDMKNINSEREIINSEHEKNILDDGWIMDDILKQFLKKNTKYTKFGTGNNESLKNITKEDILNFYNKYYTTDNLCVCIIDSNPINKMITEYVNFFNDIETKTYNKDRFEKSKLELINDNLIEFKSISEYHFLNLILIIDTEQYNHVQFQLINLINTLIGLEYIDSISYLLKEDDIIQYMMSSIDYKYDFNTLINVRFILINNDIKIIKLICCMFNDLLNKLLNLTEIDFIKIYNNYQKINLLKCLYHDEINSIDTALGVTHNLLNKDLKLAILRNYIVPSYNKEIFDTFIKMMNSVKIKIITNLPIIINDNKPYKTEWYNTKFKISNLKLTDNNIEKNYNYDLLKSIGINNFIIKSNILNINIDKKAIPKLVNRNIELKRDVYLLEYNKYSKPIANISIIRKNTKLLDNKNKLIMHIFISLCYKIINYYTEVMSDYHLYFNFSLKNDFIMLNFTGLNYMINNFIFNIIKLIHPDSIFLNNNVQKYFDKIIRDHKENINNLKYSSPHTLCKEYQSILLNDDLLPKEEFEFIDKLSFDNFKNIVIECLKYEFEIFFVIGIEDYILNNSLDYNFDKDENINYIINSLTLDPKRYLINITNQQKINDINYKINYKLQINEFNPNEHNNCIINSYILNEYAIKYLDNYIILDDIKLILKNKIIMEIISSIINEPLFDHIRTTDKLGYIVKCTFVSKNLNNKFIFIINYIIQSTFPIIDINKSINKFNIFLKNDIKNNTDKYIEIFNSLIKNKILLYEKPFTNFSEEIHFYLNSFLEKFGIFHLNEILYNISKNIIFDDVLLYIKKIFSKNNKKIGNIILDKNIKK
jgi:insulysin